MNIADQKRCNDYFNAFMCEGAVFSPNDIPFCPTTAYELPRAIINWKQAKHIHKREIKRRNRAYRYNAFVCFYLFDGKFDGPLNGVWHNSSFALKVLRHFAGVITPDFSTYQDFPEPIKIYNTYRMRAFGYWIGKQGLPVINNVRWGTEETYRYCFDGIARNSIVAIGTAGGSPKKRIDRHRFETGLDEMVRVLRPHTIITYGSANYPCFKRLAFLGIKIVSYTGHTASAYEKRRKK